MRKLELQDVLEIQAKYTGRPGQMRELAQEYEVNVVVIDRVIRNRWFTPNGIRKEPRNGFN